MVHDAGRGLDAPGPGDAGEDRGVGGLFAEGRFVSDAVLDDHEGGGGGNDRLEGCGYGVLVDGFVGADDVVVGLGRGFGEGSNDWEVLVKSSQEMEELG
jgi:hypothetical protein